jgi:hypothetical protein
MLSCSPTVKSARMLPEALQQCIEWYVSPSGLPAAEVSQYCPTRDVFEGRLSRLLVDAGRAGLPEADAALVTAVAGEIGNNSFDHNLGHWRDQPGCYFASVLAGPELLVWIADRGRGVLASLQSVLPDLADHQQALAIAFERMVSGRRPERRGNGLKFVRSVINTHANRGLVSVSGRGVLELGGMGPALLGATRWPAEQDYGMLTLVSWRHR